MLVSKYSRIQKNRNKLFTKKFVSQCTFGKMNTLEYRASFRDTQQMKIQSMYFVVCYKYCNADGLICK